MTNRSPWRRRSEQARTVAQAPQRRAGAGAAIVIVGERCRCVYGQGSRWLRVRRTAMDVCPLAGRPHPFEPDTLPEEPQGGEETSGGAASEGALMREVVRVEPVYDQRALAKVDPDMDLAGLAEEVGQLVGRR